MVRCTILLGAVLIGVGAARADGITAQELRDIAAQQAQDSAIHAQELDTGSPQSALPATIRRVDSTSTAPARATQPRRHADYRSDSTTLQTGAGAPQGAMLSDAVTVKNEYGIHLGAWMYGRLSRNVSSAEPGMVEILLTRDVIGDRRVLPAGTEFFAQHELNDATKRMELFIKKGITPDGAEFAVSGIVYDQQRVSGLPGIITVNKHNLAKHGAEKGLAAAVGGLADNLAGGNPVATAGAAATQSVLNDTDSAVNYTATTSVIYVSPQNLEIQVDADF